ncbi:glutathione S-transferase family protein [Salinicola rhizosphaerae]|uniref:Glutathione S-transferase n=1 Tax=Salinicola rhizosphaerae TaxID=1443141 RepID=A0ABQ3DNV3_9GAMM|nr:glutathione S-transferase [Salinicola rhizosphaerae]GHB07532.1 glutathione S-transferase [Salinicola rhizosphaerae]
MPIVNQETRPRDDTLIVVHHLENSRSQRIVWLLEELGVAYEIRTYRRDPRTMLAPPELKAVHPLGKSPVITDGEITIAESGAIIEYLTARFPEPALVPADGTPEKRRYTYWLHYAEGSAMPLLVMSLVFSRLGKASVPLPLRPIGKLMSRGAHRQYLDPQLRLHFDYWERELETREWFCGDSFTAADIQMSFPVLAAAGRADLAGYRRISAVLARMQARPGYRRMIEKVGEFRL